MKNETSVSPQNSGFLILQTSLILSPITQTAFQTSLEHVKAHNTTGFVSKINLCVRERLQM